MIPELFPDMDENGVRKKEKYEAMQRADKIIAISNTTKRDILTMYSDIPDEKIEVIYHGATDYSKCSITEMRNIPKTYILFVGSRGYYKNFNKFLLALAPILEADSTLNLVCTGNKGFDNIELQTQKELGIQHKVFFRKCSSDELAYLYNHAKCFVFPSLYEGFGLPILEAYSAGCPTLISNIDIFREIAGEASCYFDAQNVDDIREKINRVIHEPQYSKELIAAGKERMKEFSWDTAAKKTYMVYKGLLKPES